jgi:hypothetical protein
MSYDIYLQDPVTKETLEFPKHHITGGTCQMGGSSEAWLNVTYNYAPYYYRLMDEKKGIRVLYGMTGAESIPLLKKAIGALKDNVVDDYWEPTEGNAKQALCGLLAFAQMRPDGVWDGD